MSVNTSPSNPAVWHSSCRTVAFRNPGRWLSTGASSSTSPSLTSPITSVAFSVLVTVPIWNTESTVASTPVAVLSTPAPASTTWPPASTATATPGTP